MKMLNVFAALLTSVVLAACGGGGGSAGSPLYGGGSGGGTDGGGTDGGSVTAGDLALVLSSTSVPNSGSDTVTATVTAVDAARNALAGIPVTLRVDNGAVIVPSGTVTNANGQVTGRISIGSDRANRLVTVTATSGNLSRTAAFQVTGARLLGTAVPAVLAPGAAGQVQYRLVDVNSNPMVGQAITISGSGVTAAAGVTGSNGDYTFSYTAPGTASSLDLTAVAGGVTLVQTVLVQSGSGAIPTVPANSVLSASVAVDPSVVPVNSSTTNNRAEVRALFRGAANAPIPNVRVRFDLGGDSNSIGGSFTSGNNLVYADANGVAVTSYVPGSRSSPTDGVTIRACWDYADFAAGTCPRQAAATLTVAAEPLSVTIGTDNTIQEGSAKLTYVKRFIVLVVDAAGQAKAGVQVTPSIDLVNYYKGYYRNPGAWSRTAGGLITVSPACANEDRNRNGVLESGEDFNGNSKLDPRKADVAITMVGGSTTDASGLAVLQIEYPKNVATWLDYSILVTAAGISGTEGRARWEGALGAAASEFEADTPPSFVVSPYGVELDCANPN